jgi:phosphoribosylformimino-5-aminoimidazole carboxamide ribotide isomerase
MQLVRRLHRDLSFDLIYLADLDALQDQGDHVALILRILTAFPQLSLWLDGGFKEPADLIPRFPTPRLRPVIGSESWRHNGVLPDIDPVLSIDSDAEGLRDPSGIAADPKRRPSDLILMNLTRVGSAQGPDLGSLRHWRQSVPDARLYVAGGVRHLADLEQLAANHAAGVLLASALHQGSISNADLLRFN